MPMIECGSDPDMIDEPIFSSERATVGRFRANPASPRFTEGHATRYTFVFPRVGVYIHRPGARTDLVGPGEVPFYYPGEPYSRSLFDPRGDQCEWFSLPEPIIRRELQAHGYPWRRRGGLGVRLGRADLATYGLQRLVVRHVSSAGDPDPEFVEWCVVEIFRRVLRAGPAKPRDGRPAPASVSKVRRMLLERPADPETLVDLAARAAVSPSYMCRTFRGETGTTIHRYRLHLRLARALEMIESRPGDLSRTAFAVGFSSHSHFTATFGHAFGFTPSAFQAAVGADQIARLMRRAS